MYKRIITVVILMTVFIAGPAWADPHVWTEYKAGSFAGGNGSAETPYQIATPEQLALLASNPTAYNNNHFSITADISLDKTVDSEKVDWVPINNFSGTVNGNGHTISGMTISGSYYYKGLFGAVQEGSTISGIVIKGATITSGSAFVGLLAGSVTLSTISDCHVVGDITATGSSSYVGGLIGSVSRSNISQCSSAGTITDSGDNNEVGGLFGMVMDETTGTATSIDKCCTAMSITSNATLGGLVGMLQLSQSSSALTNCFSCSYIDAQSATNAGGLFGFMNVYNAGATINAQFAGTMAKPTSSEKYGTIFGNYSAANWSGYVNPTTITGFSCSYDRWLCNLQNNGAGYDMGSKVTAVTTPVTDTKRYNIPNSAMTGTTFSDIFLLCSMPTFITTDATHYFPYGDLLSMPVLFADGDCAGSITKVFEFPTENVSWQAANDDTYVDIITSCGAASPVSATGDGTEYLIAETSGTVKSQATKALRVMAINVNVSETPGLTFEDSNAESACLTAFDTNGDGKLTLREAVEATPSQFATFNSNAANVTTFRELRYFVGLTALSSGMISGLSNLIAVELPKTVTTIGANAFNGCTALESVTMPVAATTASGQSFYGSDIQNIYVEPKNTSLVSRSGLLFDKSDNLMAYPSGRSETSATVSGSLATINAYAFYQVSQLTSIYIDNPKPDGAVATLATNGIVAADDCDISIYINDGSYDGSLFADYKDDASWETFDGADRLHRYFPLTVTDAGWATIYIGFATQLPSEMKAYIVTESSVSTNIATLQRVNNIVPATTPLVVKCETPGTYVLLPYTGSVDEIAKWQNKLIGSYIGQESQWGVAVNLTYNSVQNTRAYFSFVINDDLEETADIKTIDNGQLTIDNGVYDLSGRRFEGQPTRKGLYIVNGKKVVIK